MNPYPSTALRVAKLSEDVVGFDAQGFANHFGHAFLVVYGRSPSGRAAPPFRTNVAQPKVNIDLPRTTTNDIVPSDVHSDTHDLEAFAVPIVRRAGSMNEFVSVGRLDGNDICFADLSVSKFHALIRDVEGAFYILDGNSKNGTKVNGAAAGKRGERATLLKSGDILQLGTLMCTYMDAAALLALAQRA